MLSRLLVVVLCGCSAPMPAPALEPSRKSPAECGPLPREIARVRDEELDEISGLAESRQNAGVLYAHNDSGDDPRFFALDWQGQVLAELVLAGVPTFVDAEEIAIGPGPGGGNFIYLADTGNNFASMGIGIPRRKAVIYRVSEPRLATATRRQELTLTDAFPIVFTFPDGARDVEAMFVDPVDGQLVLISKHAKGRSQVLSATPALLAAGGGELTLLGELRFGEWPLPGNPMPTAASVSRDGRAILVRTYSSIFLFRRDPGESAMTALSRPPRVLPSPRERQGEAITFAADDGVYITVSEGVDTAMNCATIRL